MFNTQKYCSECNWKVQYDDNNDPFNKGSIKFCPECGNKTEDRSWSPNL